MYVWLCVCVCAYLERLFLVSMTSFIFTINIKQYISARVRVWHPWFARVRSMCTHINRLFTMFSSHFDSFWWIQAAPPRGYYIHIIYTSVIPSGFVLFRLGQTSSKLCIPIDFPKFKIIALSNWKFNQKNYFNLFFNCSIIVRYQYFLDFCQKCRMKMRLIFGRFCRRSPIYIVWYIYCVNQMK